MNIKATGLADYNLYLDDITITKGRLPVNDYEVIVNKSKQYQMKLNKTIDETVNGVKLKVVGYYDSKTDKQTDMVNTNTIKYNDIYRKYGMMVYPKDKAKALETLRNDYKINVQDKYEVDKKEYIKEQKEVIRSGIVFSVVILAISLIEIYLIERSSFLSRIKEVGILRAIGMKKMDICTMFLGEILAITTIISMSGVALMTYVLATLTKAPEFAGLYTVNLQTIGTSIILIYAFNIVVGLLPVFNVLRKAPAQILARHDIE